MQICKVVLQLAAFAIVMKRRAWWSRHYTFLLDMSRLNEHCK